MVRTRIDGSGGCLAASVPVSSPGTAVIFRLAYKQPDWVKWGLAVRKDPGTWLGQATLPLLLNLEPPRLRCFARSRCQEVALEWALPESLLKLKGADRLWSWQYRWRLEESKEWTLGPEFAARERFEGSVGSFESGPLRGPWDMSLSGVRRRVEMSVRYSYREGLASAEWSDWGSGAVTLGLPTPIASEGLEVEVNDYDPCEATVRWKAFEIPGFLSSEVDYRILLRSWPESSCKGGSRCTKWVPLETDDDANRNRVCRLTGLQQLGFNCKKKEFMLLTPPDSACNPAPVRPCCDYEIRVEGRHRAVLGDGANGSWCHLQRAFSLPRSRSQKVTKDGFGRHPSWTAPCFTREQHENMEQAPLLGSVFEQSRCGLARPVEDGINVNATTSMLMLLP